jgi:DNA mismatch endonuclease (patch repair protein)
VEFWDMKLSKNIVRDATNQGLLKAAGWNVLVIWQCETNDESLLQRKLKRFLELSIDE